VGDRTLLADALAGLATDDARRARLGAAARDRVRATFTLEPLREGVHDAYRAALEPGGQ
jgi:glycosyltransferase involved in cell wall biosynthesis